ncbi:MAG: hypothetical protein JWO67_866 [Streptosporangiaceae bacterium]|nr:hypothetical protein [Streptosporangiaceae bacterium]
MTGQWALGIDACKGGWIGIALTGDHACAYFAARIEDVVSQAETDGPIGAIAVDMPIGLPTDGRRQADVLAREVLGSRRATVFMTPVRAALEADDHRAAVGINRELAGEGISRQAFALKAKLLEVDRWVRRTPYRVVEVHPEVCFAELAGGPLPQRKSTWAGATRRRRLLADAGVALADELGSAGAVAGVDDVLDAAAAAWTARRVTRGQARSMPDPPEKLTDGLAAAIWF